MPDFGSHLAGLTVLLHKQTDDLKHSHDDDDPYPPGYLDPTGLDIVFEGPVWIDFYGGRVPVQTETNSALSFVAQDFLWFRRQFNHLGSNLA